MVDKQKFSLEEIKKIPNFLLLKMINKAKKYLKNDPTMLEAFQKHNVDINYLDLMPMKFGDLDVSAKTDHGVIILNYKLLCDGDFFKDYSYLIHEVVHILQQCFGEKPTQSADDGSYLDNPYEQEGFQYQIQYIADHFGEEEAEDYVDHLLDHHDIKNDDQDDKKEVLMNKVEAFSKQAMFQAPPSMVNELTDKIIYIYASSVLFYLQSIENPDKQLLNKVYQYTNKPLKSKENINLIIDSNLDDWKYKDKFYKNLNVTLQVTVSFKEHPSRSLGIYYPRLYKMEIYLFNTNINNVDLFDTYIHELKSTVKHELMHFGQDILTQAVKSPAGVPFKKYKNKEKNTSNYKNTSEENIEHDLIDDEFFTNIQDSVDRFKRDVELIHPKLQKDFLGAWIGVNNTFFDQVAENIEKLNISNEEKEQHLTNLVPYSRPQKPFNVLRSKDPKKWRKAVQVFLKNL